LTQVLARELGHRGIRVNALCPGGVRTRMSAETIRRDSERLGRSEAELRALYESDSFLSRWAEPDEVADCVPLPAVAGFVLRERALARPERRRKPLLPSVTNGSRRLS
jgi:NAD(P)-dependent dehydrogenase (short-subunit alcohol dehydrogenase family)